MSQTALTQLWTHLRQRPQATAFTLGQERLSFGQLEERARRYASSLLALGVQPGDRVACLLHSSLEMVVALLGHYLVGAVHLPINTRYGTSEVAHILRDSQARLILVEDAPESLQLLDQVAGEGLAPRRILVGGRGPGRFHDLCQAQPLEGPPRCQDEDPALCIYTSGTTGASKGVMLPHRAVVANIDALTRLWRWSEQDTLVLALPLFHVHGLCIGVHGVLLRGCQAAIQPRFEPAQVIGAIQQGGSVFMGVPTMYARLLRSLDEQPQLGQVLARARLFTSGSAALSAQAARRFEAHTGHRILERYGMSETLLTVSNPYEPDKRKPGTIGFPVHPGDVQVQDEQGQRCAPGQVGELAVRGPSLMLGYWRSPEKTAQSFREGWFMTGDAARYDEEGYIVHVGRRSVDILKCGGYKISAREIEEALLLHPEIEEAAVVGLPDAEWGQVIAAALVTRGAATPPLGWVAELASFLEGSLARYKWPRRVEVLPELPRNALGKLQKHHIIQALQPRESDPAASHT